MSTSLALVLHPNFTKNTSYEQETRIHIRELPVGVLFAVFAYLDAPSLLRLGSTCRFLNALHKSDHLWRGLLQRKFGVRASELDVPRAHEAPRLQSIDRWTSAAESGREETPRRTSCVAAPEHTLSGGVRVDASGTASSYDVFRFMSDAMRGVLSSGFAVF